MMVQHKIHLEQMWVKYFTRPKEMSPNFPPLDMNADTTINGMVMSFDLLLDDNDAKRTIRK